LSDDYVRVLAECDLKSKSKIDKCVKAAKALLRTIESNVPAGLNKMKAYEEQKKFLENLKFKFGSTCAQHIKNAIGVAVNRHIEANAIVDNSLKDLPSHRLIYDELIQYKELMPWLAQSGVFGSEQNRVKFHYDDVKNVRILNS
jgi:hypothetical protein